MEDQQKELVESVKKSMTGMGVQILVSNKELAKLSMVVAVGAAIGTGAYLGARELIQFTKRKLKDKKEQKGWFK